MIEFESASGEPLPGSSPKASSPKIKILGVGGAGCNILSRLNASFSSGIESVVVNTDIRSLERCTVKKKFQLGKATTGGWGTGGNPEIGRRIALEEKEKLKQILEGTNLVCLVFGLGKGTGTGVSPIVAQLAKEVGSLSMGFIILPFHFEGEKRVNLAKGTLPELEKILDTLMVIPNDILLENVEKDPSLEKGFRRIDKILKETIQVLGDLLLYPGLIDLDFADFKALLQKKGHIQIAMGKGAGEQAAQDAAKQAISFPLLGKFSPKRTKGVLFNIRGGKNLNLFEVEKAASIIKEAVSPGTEVTFGASIDKSLSNEVTLGLMAVGGEIVSKTESKKKKEFYQSELDLKVYDDDLDIPTFLRKRKN